MSASQPQNPIPSTAAGPGPAASSTSGGGTPGSTLANSATGAGATLSAGAGITPPAIPNQVPSAYPSSAAAPVGTSALGSQAASGSESRVEATPGAIPTQNSGLGAGMGALPVAHFDAAQQRDLDSETLGHTTGSQETGSWTSRRERRASGGFTSLIQNKLESYAARGRKTLEKGIDQVQGAKEKLGDAKDKAKQQAPAAPEASVGALVSRLSDQVHKLIVGEIELAKVKGQAMLKRAALGGALLVVAAVLALYMLGILLGAAVSAFALIVPLWAAKLIVAGILLVLIVILAGVGVLSLKKGFQDTPAPQEGVKETISAVKKGFE